MNYKLVNYKFIEIKENQGFIENNSDDIVELCITNKEPILNDPKNTYIKPNNKETYSLQEGFKIYAKLVTRLSGEINVFSGKSIDEPIDAYTKSQSDEKFVAKADDIQANKVKFTDGKTFQQKLDDGSLRGQTGAKGANGKDGVKGEQGLNGFNGLNGLNIKIIKSETHLKGEYNGERRLYSYASKTEVLPQPIFTYQFTKLIEFRILNIPSEAVKSRVKSLSFIGVDANNEVVGSSNPSRLASGQNIFRHLGNLDPTSGNVFQVNKGQSIIKTDFDTETACLKEIEELNKIFTPQGKTIERISQITYTFEILSSTDEVIGYAVILERFNTDIKEKSYDIIPLSNNDNTAIKTVNVTVDNNTGVPSATATLSQGVLTLDFKNLKGANGINGQNGVDGKSAFNAQGQIEFPNGTKFYIE